MNKSIIIPVTALSLIAIQALAAPQDAAQKAEDESIAKKEWAFYKDIQPIIKDKCISCHSGDAPAAGKNFIKKDAFKPVENKEGDEKTVNFVTKGKPELSALVYVLEKSHDKPQMPPRKKLDDKSVKIIKAWIKQGAKPGEEPK